MSEREQHLKTIILDAERELSQLRSESEAERRKNAQKKELEQFRANVESARAALVKTDADIDSTICAIKQEAEGGVVLDKLGLGLIVNDDQSKAATRSLADRLVGLTLSRAVRARQLCNLETKLEGMERRASQTAEMLTT